MLHLNTGYLSLTLLLCLVTVGHADWPSWRGPDDLGSIEGGAYPEKIDESTIVWKTPLPGKGCSTPIVVDQTIYVTAPVDGVDALLAFDRNGNKTWVTKFGQEVAGKHRNGSGSNASPVSDGKAIFVYFKKWHAGCRRNKRRHPLANEPC